MTATSTRLDNPRTAATEPAIRVHALRKSYADTEAVRGIDLEVRRGEIFAFLGPNGAGKTTTVEILEGFRPRSEGDVSVLGVDPAARNTRLARQDRDRPPGVRTRPRPHRQRVTRALRRLLQPPALGARDDRARRPRRQGRPTGDEPLRRRAAPARLRARPDRRPRADLPRRADHRLRPLGTPDSLGRDREPPRPRQDDLPDHALHGRSRAARRPHRRDRRRTDRRPGNTAHTRRPRPGTEHDRVHAPTATLARRAPRQPPRARRDTAQTAASCCTATPRSRTSLSSTNGRERTPSSSRTSKSHDRPSKTPT